MTIPDSNIEKTLYKVSSIIHDSKSLNIIFEKLGAVIKDSIGIKNFYVALINWELDLITFPYYQDIKDHSPKEKFSSGKGMTNYAIKKNRQILINQSEYQKLVDKNLVEAIGTAPYYWLGTPLKDCNQSVVGLIAIQTYDKKVEFKEDHIKLMNFISEQLTLAIERFHHIKEVEHLTYYDPLTELPNKSLLFEEGNKIINSMEKESFIACLFIDLDNFMVINDTYGDYLSNKILQKVSYNLSKMKSDKINIYYWGADKFTIIIKDCNNIQEIKKISEDIKTNIACNIKLNNQNIPITSSIGISICPIHSENINDLCRDADIAMHQAKEKGKNQFYIFEEYMKDIIISDYGINQSLQEAVDKEQWEIYYQPQIDSESNQIIGFEALIRWNHPEKGLIMPSNFIPRAEMNDCIFDIGRYVLTEVCKQTSFWKQKYNKNLIASINLSPKEFEREELIPLIDQTLKKFNLKPENLVIEITENTFLNNNVNQIEDIKKRGIKISIDDFGTGYSSLSYLHEYSIDTIKIDKSFVHNINTDNQKKILSNSIINLAENLNLDIVTEGIENKNELKFFTDKNCKKFQGYYFSKPLSADRFEKIISNKFQF